MEKGKNEEKKSSKYKYTILVITMFIVGIFLGILFSNMNFKESKKDIDGISKDRAKDIALEDAKKDFKKDVTLESDIDIKEEKDIYKVSFYLGGMEYDYEIRISDGVILDKDTDIPMNQLNNSTSNSNSYGITLYSAKEIVLEDAKQGESKVTFRKEETKNSNGIAIYELEFNTSDKKYDYEINRQTGVILSKEIELINQSIPSNGKEITIEEAKTIALKDAMVLEQDIQFKDSIVLHRNPDCSYYEIEFYSKEKLYEYKVELSTGIILESSWKLR